MKIISYTVHEGTQILGKSPILAQAVEAAKGYAVSHNRPVIVTALYADGRVKDVEYHPDGYIRRIWAIAQSSPFCPERGKTYRNAGGGEYLCTSATYSEATMVNVASGWTFRAHGCRRYPDNSIEWDYSTDGCFGAIPKVRIEADDKP